MSTWTDSRPTASSSIKEILPMNACQPFLMRPRPRFTIGFGIVAITALVAMVPAAPAGAAAPAPGFYVQAVAEPTVIMPSHDAVQEVAITGASGGTFTLAFGGETSGPIGFDAPAIGAGSVQQALEALPAIGAGNLEVTGRDGGPYAVTFTGVLGAGEREAMTADSTSLTGSSPEVTVSVVAPGFAGEGNIVLLAQNIGAAPTNGEPVVTEDTLPPGISLVGELTGEGQSRGFLAGSETPSCTETAPRKVTCTSEGTAGGDGEGGFAIDLLVRAEPGAAENTPLTNEVQVSGGGLQTLAQATNDLRIGSEPAAFGFSSVPFLASDESGSPSTQAGSHPNLLTAGFAVTAEPRTPEPESARLNPDSLVQAPKDVLFELPVGFVGNAQAAASCPQNLVLLEYAVQCPPGAEIGNVVTGGGGYGTPALIVSAKGSGEGQTFLTNSTPSLGFPAEFDVDRNAIPVPIYSQLAHTPAGYVIRTVSPNITRQAFLQWITLNFFGDPDARNGEGSPRPFFTMPADCQAAGLHATIHVDSWADPAPLPVNADGSIDFEGANFNEPQWINKTIDFPTPNGCEKLRFEPTLSARPTTIAAEAPSGLDVDLKIPQDENPSEDATPPLKDAVVTLPKGVAIDPSSADGLEVCTSLQINLEATRPGGCPSGSKLGEVELTTPLLGHTLGGSMFLAAPECAPCTNKDAEEGKLARLYLEIADPESGTFIKLPGFARLDPATGRVTADFPEQPQLPFSDLKVKLKEGPRAPLVTPSTCGSYETTSSLTPWSAPQSGPPATPSDQWSISQGAGGGACASSEAQLPDHVSLSAGTQATQAGAYSPLVIKVSREDGTQRLTNLNVTLPPGLTGRLAGVAYCPEAAIKVAEGRSGAAEKASPTCPSSSELGTVDVAAGAGPTPYHVQGHAYLAGPYKGAPLSMAIVTPAVAGPFDLGTVVVRSALYVDPITAQITAKSDPIPTMLAGIPLDVRSISVDISRNRFTINPTNCEKMTLGAQAETILGQTASLSNPFQVGGCKSLGFKPKLKLSLKGKTSRTGHPALKAVLTMPEGGANIARAQVSLPHSEFLDQGNLNKVCTHPELLEGICPASSVYGHAKAWSPLLENPLEGNVYLGVGFGYKLPAMVAELNGQIRVLLVGKVDTDKQKGIRNTFEVVPDAPVSRFVLELKGGKKYGLLENSENICRKVQKAAASFIAQSGKVDEFQPTIANSCRKPKTKKGKGRRGAVKRGHHRHHGGR